MNKRTQFKHFLTGLLVAASGVVFASTFDFFAPATGVLKGNASSYVTTAAVSADIRGLWTGSCDATTFLRGEGACAQVSLTTNVSGLLPVANGGTGQGSLSTDNLFMGNGTGAMSAKAIPSCSTATSAVTYDTTAHTWGCNTVAGGITGLANPTATVGLSAVNGVAATAMRSDAAPPLSQAITPTWTGAHIWSNTATFNSSVLLGAPTGGGLGAGTLNAASDIRINNVAVCRSDGTNCPAGGTGGNPTASVGLTAVNGVATSFIRSDGAPALSQSIAPSWTGTHQFKGAPTRFGTTSLLSPGLVSSNIPMVSMVDGSGAADQKAVEIFDSTGTFTIQNINDGGTVARAVMQANRGTGPAIASLVFGNTTDNAPFTIQGTGLVSMGGSSPAAGSNVQIGLGSAPTTTAANRGAMALNGATDALFELDNAGSLAGYLYGAATEMRLLGNTSRTLTFYSNNTLRLKIDTDGSWDMAGTSPGASGDVLTSNGSGSAPTFQTPAAASTTGTYTATLATGCTTTPTATYAYAKIGSIVVVHGGNFGSCTSNSTIRSTDASLPAAVRPATAQGTQMIPAIDNGTATVACVRVQATGVIDFEKSDGGCGGTGWTNSGSTSLSTGWSVSYQTAN